MSEKSGYALKTACLHCKQWGTIDDGSLICGRCGTKHEITESEARQRDADMVLWQSAMQTRRRFGL